MLPLTAHYCQSFNQWIKMLDGGQVDLCTEVCGSGC